MRSGAAASRGAPKDTHDTGTHAAPQCARAHPHQFARSGELSRWVDPAIALALLQCLEEVESFSYDPDYGHESHLTLAGKKRKREVVIEIYFEPFDDDEATTIFDVNIGGCPDKRMDED